MLARENHGAFFIPRQLVPRAKFYFSLLFSRFDTPARSELCGLSGLSGRRSLRVQVVARERQHGLVRAPLPLCSVFRWPSLDDPRVNQ